jgi:DNA-binding NtrC family response regulator
LDPDKRTTSRLAGLLEEDGFEVETLPDGASAMRRMAKLPEFDSLVTELNLPLADASKVVRSALAQSPRMQIVVLTRYPNLVLPERLGGAPNVLSKPLDYGRLLQLLGNPAAVQPGGPAQHTDGC